MGIRGLLVLAAALVSVAGCSNLGSVGGTTQVELDDETGGAILTRVEARWRDIPIEIEGFIAAPGLCQRLQGDDGRLHAVVGSIDKYPPGTRVRVSGPTAVWADCPLGSVIRADRIERIGASG